MLGRASMSSKARAARCVEDESGQRPNVGWAEGDGDENQAKGEMYV